MSHFGKLLFAPRKVLSDQHENAALIYSRTRTKDDSLKYYASSGYNELLAPLYLWNPRLFSFCTSLRLRVRVCLSFLPCAFCLCFVPYSFLFLFAYNNNIDSFLLFSPHLRGIHMFTGLVEALGTIQEITPDGNGGQNFWVGEEALFADATIGESIAINGACLTVVEIESGKCLFQAGPETLQKTNLGELRVGDRVNLERAMRSGDRFGGHMVQGHVDGIGSISRREQQGDWEFVWFQCPSELASQMVPKGSVTVDGISLTVVDVTEDGFSVALIPHTLAMTTLGTKQVGAKVNLEIDILAKYVWKYLETTRT